MGAEFVPEGHGPRSELCPGQSEPAEGTSVRVASFGQSVEHVAAPRAFHQVSKSVSSRTDADRHITGVHERAEGIQVAAVQQVEGEAVGTDGQVRPSALSVNLPYPSSPTAPVQSQQSPWAGPLTTLDKNRSAAFTDIPLPTDTVQPRAE